MTTNAKGPFRLVTVNTAPERAQKVIGMLAGELKERYVIEHVANCETIEEVSSYVKRYHPDVLFCASMWTSEQSEEIERTAKEVKPGLATYAIPYGLQVDKGPSGIVEHLVGVVPGLLDGI